ncbi:MAG: hypothetical protein HY704_16615 [Gemmatimonadetes bacterium]|nr:hypothetical protein [Gemmatimonadota bacterium]
MHSSAAASAPAASFLLKIALQEVNPFLEVHSVSDLASTLETRTTTLGFGVTFVDGASLSVERDERFERLREPFRVRTDAVIPAGDYAFRETRAEYRSSSGRSLSPRLGLSDGGFFSGTRTSLDAGLEWRVDHHVSLEVTCGDAR